MNIRRIASVACLWAVPSAFGCAASDELDDLESSEAKQVSVVAEGETLLNDRWGFLKGSTIVAKDKFILPRAKEADKGNELGNIGWANGHAVGVFNRDGKEEERVYCTSNQWKRTGKEIAISGEEKVLKLGLSEVPGAAFDITIARNIVLACASSVQSPGGDPDFEFRLKSKS